MVQVFNLEARRFPAESTLSPLSAISGRSCRQLAASIIPHLRHEVGEKIRTVELLRERNLA